MDCATLPTYNRMPPDGHEFPQKYQEEMKLPPPLPVSEPPKRFGRLGSAWRQDEKSEKSVRDKIAMFSSAAAEGVNNSKLLKYKSSEDVFGENEDRMLRARVFSRSVYSVDKLPAERKHSYSGDLDFSGRAQSHVDLTSSSSAYSSSCSPDSSLSSTTSSCLGYSSTLPRKSPLINEPNVFNNNFTTHVRSQSLSEITPLNALVEQRRKNLSKLRGLVIPERVNESNKNTAVEIPEIKTKLSPVKTVFEVDKTTKVNCFNNNNINLQTPKLPSPPWKISTPNAAIPKYSPAFKRKSISIYGSGLEVSSYRKGLNFNYDSVKPKRLDFCNKNSENIEDSDNDSAVSSSRSSISPPASPLLGSQTIEMADKMPLSRTVSSDTTGSDFDSLNRRILKAQSVEAINRKNVLTSAKYSRGFDIKSGSPPIQRKTAEDNLKDNSEVIYYQLAANYKPNPGKITEVKIAFLNHVDIPTEKLKLEKTESMPVNTEMVPSPSPRRVSCDWSEKINGHTPLSNTVSGSSVDTIVELPNPVKKSTDTVDSRKHYNQDSMEDNVEDKRNGNVNNRARNRRSVSVNDIRKAFERVEITQTQVMHKASEKINGNHARVSSFDSTTSDDSSVAFDFNQHRDQFGSITSLASSTSLISPQELQSLIDEANLTLEEATCSSGAPPATSHDVLVVILHRDSIGGSVGITLAGGADYEAKEITVHKVLAGSPADRDGRIQKGDRILSINGKSMKGATHRESLTILKQPRPEVVLVISRLKSEANQLANQETNSTTTDDSFASSLRFSLNGGSNRPPRIIEGSLLNDPLAITDCDDDIARGPPQVLNLVKDGAGLGFSLEGGKDSPLGDKPLVVKKIFTGGAAEKNGTLQAGDEILTVNGVDVSQMSRIEAWKLMKRIPEGPVSITIRRVLSNITKQSKMSC